MSLRISLFSFLFVFPILGWSGNALNAQGKPKDLQWTHAFDLSCRKYGEAEFTKNTRKYGVEAFRDNNNGNGFYISERGAIALAGGFQNLKIPVENPGPKWITGLDLPARKAGEKEFTATTKAHSMEVFLDPNTDNWLYITEQGHLAVAPAKGKNSAGANKAPVWSHSVDLMVRKGGSKEWKDATKYGLEVYRDSGTGNLVYICETGTIAVIPEVNPVKGDGKAPEWLHGLDLACRKFDETSFTNSTRKYGIEIFRDENNGNLIFINEAGGIAVTAGPAKVTAPTKNVKTPQWSHGINAKCRSFGEKDFSEKTRVYGGEVFLDENINVLIYINEVGNITGLSK